jgi:hypothetical protein
MMARYPYRDLDIVLDRDFRNNLNANFDDIEADLRDIQNDLDAKESRLLQIESESIERDNDLDARIDNLILSAGDSGPEVADARYDSRTNTTFPTLKDRLDTHSNEIGILNTQLADIVKETTSANLQSVINDFASRGVKLTLKRQVYEIESTLLIPSNIEIDFNFSTIKRKAGSGVFDLIVNSDTTNGNSNIRLRNLIIDGNKDIDGLVAENIADRFSGLKLVKVSNSVLENITVTKTVNAEDQGDVEANRPAAGIYFLNCTDIDCKNLNGYNNDRTAILVNKSRVRIDGSLTYNNLGSGISSIGADESEYHNITSYNNGYSNVSVNGLRSKVSNVLTYGSGYSGLNIGHNGAPSDDTVVVNVHAYNNAYEGLTIGGSARVQVTGIEVHGNQRNNIRIFDGSTASKLVNVISRDSAGGNGISYESGKAHKLLGAEIYKNAVVGVYVTNSVTVDMVNVDSYNNGQITSTNSGGIVLNTANDCVLINVKAWDDQEIKTQESGIWIAGGSGHRLLFPDVKNNKTYQIRKTTSPTNIVEHYPSSGVLSISTFLNGWTSASVNYEKNSNGDVRVWGRLSGGTVGSPAFNLPSGFRPGLTIKRPTIANNTSAYAEINTNGDFIPYVSNVNHDFDITFKQVL